MLRAGFDLVRILESTSRQILRGVFQNTARQRRARLPKCVRSGPKSPLYCEEKPDRPLIVWQIAQGALAKICAPAAAAPPAGVAGWRLLLLDPLIEVVLL